MSEAVSAIEKEIEITAASLQERTAELDREVRAVAQAVTTGAKVIGRRYPWALLGMSIATGILCTRRVTDAAKSRIAP